MNATFKRLERGEPIGVAALSGPVDRERLEAGLGVVRGWGHPVVVAENVGRRAGYLAGDDEERLAGLAEVVEHGARWIVAARGGYGATRLLDRLGWDLLHELDVALVGFSDVTALLNPLARRGGTVQVHGPMVAAGLHRPRNAARLRHLMEGSLRGECLFRFGERQVVRHGAAVGASVGGNLSVLVSLIGTDWEPDFAGSVVFLEDVGEPLYRLDRMLTHLRSSGRLRKVKALIGGSLRDCRPAPERSRRWCCMLEESAPEGAPVVVDLPFGHGAVNLALPIGAEVSVDTRLGCVVWS